MHIAITKILRVVRHWSRFPREVGESLSLEVRKERAGAVLGNVIYWAILVVGGRLEQVITEVFSSLNGFMIL